MKRLILVFLFFLISCYRPNYDNPNHPKEFIGSWMNEKTTINGVPDDIYPDSKVPHYIFDITQSEVMLPTISGLGIKYQNWKIIISKDTTLLLYKESSKNPPDMTFKIIKYPTYKYMVVSYMDSIVYYLKK